MAILFAVPGFICLSVAVPILPGTIITLSFPWQIHIGTVAVPVHTILETAAFFIGFRYFLFLRKKSGDAISKENRVAVLIGAVFGSLIGSRIVGGLENPQQLAATSSIFLHFFINKTILGGLLGGLAGVETVKKSIGERRSSGDLFTFPIILAMIIGRFGCFSMGIHEETYGLPTGFFAGMDLGDGLRRHPVALYEMLFLALLWMALLWLGKNREMAEGTRFRIFMISYCIFRLLLDFIKPRYVYAGSLSIIQLTAIAGLVYYAYIILKPGKKH